MQFEQDEKWGHLQTSQPSGAVNEFRSFLWDHIDEDSYKDPKTKSQFINVLRQIISSNNNMGKSYFQEDGTAKKLTFKMDTWLGTKPSQFTFEQEGELWQGDSRGRQVFPDLKGSVKIANVSPTNEDRRVEELPDGQWPRREARASPVIRVHG